MGGKGGGGGGLACMGGQTVEIQAAKSWHLLSG